MERYSQLCVEGREVLASCYRASLPLAAEHVSPIIQPLEDTLMAAVDPQQVMALHRRTDMPVMECKTALVEAGGDLAAAIKVLHRRSNPLESTPSLEEAQVRLDLRRDFAEVYEHL